MIASEIICALISGIVTLIVAIGTWYLTARKDRAETSKDIKKSLDDHYAKNQADMKNLQGDIVKLQNDMMQVDNNIQNKVSIIEVRIENLTKQVEKHNNVVERMFKLEQQVEDLDNCRKTLQSKGA